MVSSARFNVETGLLEPSRFSLARTGFLGRLVVRIFALLGLTRIYPAAGTRTSAKPVQPTTLASEDANADQASNLTLINMLLVHFGPLHEQTLTTLVLVVQVLGSLVAFAIRYPLAALIYESLN